VGEAGAQLARDRQALSVEEPTQDQGVLAGARSARLICTHTHATHLHTHNHTQPHRRTRTHTHTPTTHTYTTTHTHTHANTHTHARTHANTHTHTHKHAHTHTHKHTHIHTQPHTHKRTHTRTCMDRAIRRLVGSMRMIPDPRQIGDGGGDGPPIPGKSGMGPPSPSPDKSGMRIGGSAPWEGHGPGTRSPVCVRATGSVQEPRVTGGHRVHMAMRRVCKGTSSAKAR
jgi:hypothetical protein